MTSLDSQQEAALNHAEALLADDPVLAQVVGEGILRVVQNHPRTLLVVGMALHKQGNDAAAAAMVRRSTAASAREPGLAFALELLLENRTGEAEAALLGCLAVRPNDIVALRALADVHTRRGRDDLAIERLAQALTIAPAFVDARSDYAGSLFRGHRAREAITEADRCLRVDPESPRDRLLKAACLANIGEYEDAIALFDTTLEMHPGYPGGWLSFGHALRTAGRQSQAIRAYRRCLELAPHFGEAWWSLANLKTVSLTPSDIDSMERSLSALGLTDGDRFHLHFALGKACEDTGAYAASFGHYAQAASLRRRSIGYAADRTSDHVRRSKALFTPSFFADRAGQGAEAPDPIFIVGLPRAGSTLVEQILASHSQIEGTHELPDIIAIARRLAGVESDALADRYPEALATLSAEDLKALGEEYLTRAKAYRRLGRPFFIDKMPNNWLHLGLILLALPNAKIVDARRHPLGCGFSNFKQHFANGQEFTYDLIDLGRYYSDYVEMMAHLDGLMPGRIHRVYYEYMVESADSEIRQLLDYCGLSHEEGCLRFYDNDRPVRTASSEQVRRPIFTEGLNQWKHFEPWLEPLKRSLGPTLAAYPRAPEYPPAVDAMT